jgi:transcriptional regulator with XRE-family HTH domain
MGVLDERARQRITTWLQTSGKTQTAVAEAIGRNQAWMSRYLDAEFDTDLETLERLAAQFGHTLFHLLNVPGDDDERALLEQFRAVDDRAREAVVKLLEILAAPRTPRGRTRLPRGG